MQRKSADLLAFLLHEVVKMKIIKIKKPEKIENMDSAAAQNYFSLKVGSMPFLEDEIVKPFEQALKESTGFSDEKRPKDVKIKSVNLDGIVFSITTKPTTKRPSYQNIYDNLVTYLSFVEQEYNQGIRKEGVLTLDSAPYISADLVLEKLNGWRDEVLREGIEQKIAVTKIPEELEEDIDAMTVSLINYGELNPANAKAYIRALNFKAEGSEIVNCFEDNLKSETGFSKKNMPSETADSWVQTGNYLFRVQSVPYDSTSYGKIINKLAKEDEMLEKSGELVLISNGIEILDDYDVKVRDGKQYISLDKLNSRIKELTDKNTKPTLKQNIDFYLI